jgi:hypothetical protein
MSSTTNYKFEEDTQAAFRSILQLSSNYRELHERCEQQEQTIRDLREQLLKSEEIKLPNPSASVTKEYIVNSYQDVSKNKVVTKNPHVINRPTNIGPLECKPLNPTTVDCSNILQDTWHKKYPGTKVGEPGETMSRNPHLYRAI